MPAIDLDLTIGDVLHLEPAGGGGPHRARLIGSVPGRSLVVTTPEADGKPVNFAPGEALSTRVFAGDDVLAFSCTVQGARAEPYPYLHLSYPDAFESTPMRHTRRAHVRLKGTAESDRNPGRESPISLHDISTLGALVWSDAPLGDIGQAMLIRLPLEAEWAGEPPAELVSEIRNVQEDATEAVRRWRYGVEFSSMSSATALALRRLVSRELTRGRL